MVNLVTKKYYVCKCDNCGNISSIEKDEICYNKAQAVRSLGWSYGRNKEVYCIFCRQSKINDRHKNIIK